MDAICGQLAMIMGAIHWDQAFGALVGAGAALTVWGLTALRDSLKHRDEKKDLKAVEAATVRVAEIVDNATFRNELWKRINDLEDSVALLSRQVSEEKAKATDCEHRYDQLSAKVDLMKAQMGGAVEI